jgi:alkanesulfonate monooxygenase SsuD/methylene tetrahydromethanopterin reductase-like flavin-dependent oxidoreductase (luciferase family)
VCDVVEGRFLQAGSMSAVLAAAAAAEAAGLDAVFVADGPLGDAVAVAAGLSARTSTVLLGVRTALTNEPHRHPTMLARELTTLDRLSRGRALLAVAPPFTDGVGEAITLCRAMWREGVAASDGPHYPVAGAINRPRAYSERGPLVALDLGDGTPAPPDLVELADLLLQPTDDPLGRRIDRV